MNQQYIIPPLNVLVQLIDTKVLLSYLATYLIVIMITIKELQVLMHNRCLIVITAFAGVYKDWISMNSPYETFH